jgi:glutaryl-CoA dehydrogenase (non-decarboxylating)
VTDFRAHAQTVFREEVRAFAEREIAPKIRELDGEERFDPSILRAMAEAGLLGTCIPRAMGGQGLSYHHLAVAFEELERVDTFARVILSVHLSLNSLALYQWGTPDQQERWLRPQATGEKVAGFALTEPEAGTDAGSLSTRAEKAPGGYRLTGAKAWIGLADVADHFLLFATLSPPRPPNPGGSDQARPPNAGGSKHRAITAFLVKRGAEGLRTESITGKHGIRAGNVGRIFLDGVFVPEEDRLGEEGEGFQIAMSALDNGRFGVAAGSVGVIQACLDACVPRCRERKSFGEEIGRHQLVQQMLAKMVAARDVGRLLVSQVADMKCGGVRHTREVSLAKWLNCDAAYQSANDAVQIFGAHGYSSEHPVERYLRNCRAAVIYEGTREIHQVIQAEYALGYRQDRPLRRPLPPYPFPEDADGA